MKKYRIVDGERSVQGSQEWLDFRNGKISASIVPSIMGVGFKTRLQAWESIVMDIQTPRNEAMQRGIDLEPKARDWINMLYDCNFQPMVIQSRMQPDFIASLDGYYEDKEGNPNILEIKCAGAVDHAIALSGEVPPKYYPQCQFQMYVAGVNEMTYLSYTGENNAIVLAKYDPDYSVKMVHECEEFLDNLINLRPPKASDKDWIEVEDEGRKMLLDSYNMLCEQYDEIKLLKERLKSSIIDGISHDRTKIGNNRIQKIAKKGEIDYSRLIEDFKLHTHLERYRKPGSSYWKIGY